ncbi:MAG: PQQ-binding-like beta-propeller repeat protein [Planctomycetes bacterium]|nr:PQQ-binding-like beta-propeller repeat protein [Planctomycetota bacterium]
MRYRVLTCATAVLLLVGGCAQQQSRRLYTCNLTPDEAKDYMREELALPPLQLTGDDAAPIVMRDDVVDSRTGRVIRKAEWGCEFWEPKPVVGRRGIYSVECRQIGKVWLTTPFNRMLDSRTGKVIEDQHPEMQIVKGKEFVVVRQDVRGKEIWSREVAVDGKRVRPYFAQRFEDKVVVSHDKGLTGLDASTGDLVWNWAGGGYFECCSDDLVLAAGQSNDDNRWVAGVQLQDGKELFRIPVPDVSSVVVAGKFFVATNRTSIEASVIFDGAGAVVARLNESIVASAAVDSDLLLLTSKRLLRMTPTGDVSWQQTTFAELTMSLAGGRLQLLPNGDALALAYTSIADTPERLVRLSASTGHLVWSIDCGGIGYYSHSMYSHAAYVEIRDGWAFVVAHASHGDTISVISLERGSLERTWVYHRPD